MRLIWTVTPGMLLGASAWKPVDFSCDDELHAAV